jgi:hypothetical protein
MDAYLSYVLIVVGFVSLLCCVPNGSGASLNFLCDGYPGAGLS